MHIAFMNNIVEKIIFIFKFLINRFFFLKTIENYGNLKFYIMKLPREGKMGEG